MAKFYVQSGSFRGIVDSEDAERAALWAVHRVMESVLPIYGDEPDEPEEPSTKQPSSLGNIITISEQGFDRIDGQVIDTWEAFNQWYDLIRAVERLGGLM